MNELRDVCWVLLWFGVALVILPGIAILGALFYPCVPHAVNEFFLNPEFDQPEDDEEEGKAGELSDKPKRDEKDVSIKMETETS